MKSSNEALEYFAAFIYKELGIVYKEANYYQLDTRISEVASQLGFSDPAEFFTSAKRLMTPQMRLLILDLATNNETLFFRDPVVFKNIENHLLTKLELDSNRTAPLKIWSAACSYGQEVYSLAMTFEKIRETLPGKDFEILASDISSRALAAAEKGEYTQLQVQRGLPAMMMVKYFEQVKEAGQNYQWRVKDELRKNVRFKKINLTTPFGAIGTFDVVLCRNVLIYQNVEGKREILHNIFERLNPGGILIMGAAESLLGVTDKFELMGMEKSTFFQKPFLAGHKKLAS